MYKNRAVYDQILPNLFLGGQQCVTHEFASDYAALAITTTDLGKPTWAREYLHIQLEDNPSEPAERVKQAIKSGLEYIDKHIDDGIVVYCGMGVSRSATIIIAYIMRQYKWTFERALQFVKTKRDVCPNLKFRAVLAKYQFEAKWVE
ncbi:Dual-specificity_protein phosphatase [Hexamita inflata]|uniref:protein-tyrosine-phosphatase n=1 Tax=Hexamita inflata TaxID=28002 RepID=A0AA86NR10_9EUKA|nr:Dual-specificity protein phosphatase [Hexamita inflata]